MRDMQDEPAPPPPREPAFNIPWTVLGLMGALIAAHGARILLGLDGESLALTQSGLATGDWRGLVTHLFVHASWTHVLMNSVFILAFGPPVARFLQTGARGAAAFFGFFLICGAVAGLGYAGWRSLLAAFGHPDMGWGLVGASGAASSFMGAAARLIDGGGRLGGLGGRAVIGMTLTWIAANALLGVLGLTPGAGNLPVAWEAHIVGYFAGLLLIGGFARLAGVVPYPSRAP